MMHGDGAAAQTAGVNDAHGLAAALEQVGDEGRFVTLGVTRCEEIDAHPQRVAQKRAIQGGNSCPVPVL